MKKLARKHFLITGASSGIGLSTAKLFIEEGAVITGMARNLDRMKAAFKEKGLPEDRTLPVKGDVVNFTDSCNVIKAGLKRFGPLNGLVHCAAYDFLAPMAETFVEDWQKVIQTNLSSAFFLGKAVFPELEAAGGGVIINISSAAGLKPLLNRSAYCSSKAGLVALGQVMAMEGAPRNIRVNTVCPGVIDTPMLYSAWEKNVSTKEGKEEIMNEIRSRNLMRRVAQPEEVATAILYLACDDSSFVTGTALAVDGGRTFH